MGKFIYDLFRKSLKFKTIKDSEKAPVSVRFGLGAIINSIFMVILAFLGGMGVCGLVGGSYFIDTSSWGDNFVTLIFAIILAVVGSLSVLLLSISAILNVVYQFKLNKRGIRYAALVVTIIAIIGSVALLILAF